MKRARLATWTALVVIGLPASAFAGDPDDVLERYRAWRGGAAFGQLNAVRSSGAMTGLPQT